MKCPKCKSTREPRPIPDNKLMCPMCGHETEAPIRQREEGRRVVQVDVSTPVYRFAMTPELKRLMEDALAKLAQDSGVEDFARAMGMKD